jgi:hypothetical protein
VTMFCETKTYFSEAESMFCASETSFSIKEKTVGGVLTVFS